jgi:tetratricopeptide (TPR) repeat protein
MHSERRRRSEPFAMNSKIPPQMILGMVLLATGPTFAAQPLLLGHAPTQQQSPQANSDAHSTLSPKETQEEHAKIFMAEKRYEDAIQAYEELLKSDPKSAIYLNMVGIGYLDLSNFDQARKYFQRAVKADKKYSSAVNNLGMVYYHQKNFRRAIREYQRAIKIEPRQAGTHVNLGFAYYNTNKFELAAAEFAQAIELDPLVFQRTARVGTMVEDRSVTNHGLFFFTMARIYAQKTDAAHCAEYLRKSFDEGYKDVAKAKTDPAFKTVLNDPDVQAVLALATPAEQKDAASQPGA